MNRWQSSGKRTSHIEIRYFYVKDLVDKGRIKIKYCPTHKMLADFFTKPLQGNLFRTMKRVILGQEPLSHLDEYMTSSSKERVEE